jgi:3-methyladenine DNA glycosylase AlkD
VNTATAILAELKALGKDSYKRVMMKHGAAEPFYGVSIEELKKIQKRVKVDHQLALDLYATGVYDAMYLAGLVADDARMSAKELQRWADTSTCLPLSQYTVAWVAAGSPHGLEMALRWIDSKKEQVATSGWATLSSLVSVLDDADLDLALLRKLLDRAASTIHKQPNRVRLVMNGFVIAVGCFVKPLHAEALQAARTIGVVKVDMGDTACKVGDAVAYIRKVKQRGTVGKKRKSAKC